MTTESEFNGRALAAAEHIAALAGQSGPEMAEMRHGLDVLIECSRRAAWLVDDVAALADSIDHLEAARRAIRGRP